MSFCLISTWSLRQLLEFVVLRRRPKRIRVQLILVLTAASTEGHRPDDIEGPANAADVITSPQNVRRGRSVRVCA